MVEDMGDTVRGDKAAQIGVLGKIPFKLRIADALEVLIIYGYTEN